MDKNLLSNAEIDKELKELEQTYNKKVAELINDSLFKAKVEELDAIIYEYLTYREILIKRGYIQE